VAQELKRSRYSQSYRFDQGKIVVFCDKQRSIAAFLCADKFFFSGFDLIADAKSKLHGDG
jgi:hypothetical protein